MEEDPEACTSDINYIEVLGYPWLNKEQREEFQAFFDKIPIIGMDQAIRDRAIHLKREEKLKTADAIIAATGLVNDISLVTRDTDFRRIKGLSVIDPDN